MGKQFWKPGNMLYPVPAVMVSCGREGEQPNIITVAWASTSCSSPAMISISIRPERYSYNIIKETGEFVVNLVTEDLVYAADYCGVKSGRDLDKFAQMKLTPLESKTVKAPGISESPVNIECKVVQIIPLGSHDLFLGEVTGVTVDDQYMDENGKFHLSDAGLTVYSHGEYYGLGEKLGKFGYSVAKKKNQKNGQAGKVNKTDKINKADKASKTDKINKADKANKTDKASKTDKVNNFNKDKKVSKSSSFSKNNKMDRHGSTDKKGRKKTGK